MKILAAGGAGYIGSRLVPVLIDMGYEVDVIDNLWFGNHLPKEVRVIQKDLFNLNKEDLNGYDQVIFLAGLSNDPMAEFSPKLNFMYNVALPAYLAFQSKGAGVKRFIYASSCSIYGYTLDRLYTEEDPTSCNYPYGVSKLQGEVVCTQLRDEDFSVIVLRQGTVSGYSPRMRLDLIVNTMFKTSVSEGRIIVNNPSIWRPILDIRDAINAYIKAIQANQSISGVFNIASENYSVGQVAEVVKVEVEKRIKKEIKGDTRNVQDFRNYKVSIEKARTILGFKPQHRIQDIIDDLFTNQEKFLDFENKSYYNIKIFQELEKEINITDFSAPKKENNDLREEIIIRGADNFNDKRGSISNYYLNEPVNWIGLITTERVKENGDTIRGNHYHPEQEQRVLVISGSYISLYKDLSSPNSSVKHNLVRAGDLVITPPNMAHAQIFLEDTISLNLVTGERKQENYGKHTIPYELIKPSEIGSYKEYYNRACYVGPQLNCRACNSTKLKKVISFGKSPLANNLLDEKDINGGEELYPLEVMYCEDCHLCQLSYIVPPKKMFGHYLFVTSTTETNRRHFEEMAKEIMIQYGLQKNSLVVDIGSNDGTLLKYFREGGMKVMGVEPASNIAEIARNEGIETLNVFWDKESAEKILRINGKADVITATNVFAHVSDIHGFAENVKKLLKDDGIFVIEAQYLLDTLKGVTFDNIYHEHVSYYSILALENFFKKEDLEIFKVERFDVHGGSIRVFIQKSGGKQKRDTSVDTFLDNEKIFGLDKFSTYEQFAQNILNVKEKIREVIINLKGTGNKIVGYGAPAKATTALNFYQIDNRYLDYIVEDNPLKRGKIVPGIKIPIKGKDFLEIDPPDYIYVLAWNYTEEILKNNESQRNKGVKFIIPYPELKII
ncbi:MAG: NAD-dependent epimerase/dehydratase family protein [Nanoarchaeota archaeon]|nr:NAD-dependent epimerase/dehydratase family protein [Nanoarchaeota archaeon]